MNYNKVIFVCNYAANYAGNFLASLNSLAKQLKKKRKTVIFIFPLEAKDKNWEIDLSEFQIIYSDFNNNEVLLKDIKNEILSGDRVIVHTHFISSIFLLKLKSILSNSDKIVFHQHMAVNYGLRQTIKGIILRLFGFGNTIYVGVSFDVYHDICQEVGKSKTRLVTNSLDLERLQCSDNRIANNSDNNILIFGTDYRRKGVDLAINAVIKAYLDSKVKLVVVTHNPDNAETLIKREFGKIPHFVSVISPSNNVQELYKNSFLFLSPSRLEAFGYSVIEAAYSGLKVIASDVPGQNTLKNVPNIKWIDSENVQQLSNAILEEYNSPREDSESILETKKAIEENYSLDRWVKQIMKIYNE